MANSNQTKKPQSVAKPEPTSGKPSAPAKKGQNENVANVKKAAREATKEALDTGESPA